MAKQFYYKEQHTMTTLPGRSYATTYYRQTLEQRLQVTRHIRSCTKEILDYLDTDLTAMQWATGKALKGFPQTQARGNRTFMTILTDLVHEARGRRTDGTPKDYAQAPIDRWNRLFDDTDYEIVMQQNEGIRANTFGDLWEIEP